MGDIKYGFLQYMADRVITLHRQVMEKRVALCQLRVIKYRGASVAEAAFPFVIEQGGTIRGHTGRDSA